VSLQGSEVQLVQPSEEELAGLYEGRRQQQQQQGGSTVTGAVSAAAASAAGLRELERKTATVFVLEGQTLSWTLNLTNISSLPVVSCQVWHG